MSSDHNDDAWAAARSEAAPDAAWPARLPSADGELPSVVGLLNACLEDVKRDLAPLALAGLGFTLAVLAVVVVALPTGLVFALPGAIAEDELLTTLGLLVWMLFYVGLLLAVSAPLTGSVMRAVDDYLQHGTPLTFGSAFRTPANALWPMIAFMALSATATLFGMMFCYLPGLAVALLLGLGSQAVALDGLGPLAAIRRSVGHARAHFTWHLGFWGLGFAILMVGQYVPIIGPMVYYLYIIRGYRALFPRAA